MYDVGAILLW